MISADITMQALGTHNGFAHILDLTGQRIKTFKPHTASIVDMCFDTAAEFIGTASMDGKYSSPSSFPHLIFQTRTGIHPFHFWSGVLCFQHETPAEELSPGTKLREGISFRHMRRNGWYTCDARERLVGA